MVDFKDWATERAQHFERIAQSALPPEHRMPWKLSEAVRYSVLDGGKRVRPLLVYAAGQLVDAPAVNLDHIALAVEYIHSYSLVHDDMPCMDNDTLRRGKLTTHRKYGEAMALLAGDTLQAQAFFELTQVQTPAEQIKHLVQILATAAGSSGMCGGQGVDLLAVNSQLDLATLTVMHRMKTGAMIRASALMGLYASNDAPDVALVGAVTSYAMAVGLAFQVIDDILDATAETEVLGKTAGKDAAQSKPTYVSLLGVEKAREMAQEQMRQAQEALEMIEAMPGMAGKTARLAQLAQYVMDRDH